MADKNKPPLFGPEDLTPYFKNEGSLRIELLGERSIYHLYDTDKQEPSFVVRILSKDQAEMIQHNTLAAQQGGIPTPSVTFGKFTRNAVKPFINPKHYDNTTDDRVPDSILTYQYVPGKPLYHLDNKHDYSTHRKASRYVWKNHYTNLLIVGGADASDSNIIVPEIIKDLSINDFEMGIRGNAQIKGSKPLTVKGTMHMLGTHYWPTIAEASGAYKSEQERFAAVYEQAKASLLDITQQDTPYTKELAANAKTVMKIHKPGQKTFGVS